MDMDYPPLRVAVADDEPLMRIFLEETVTEFGHEVVSVSEDGIDLIESCHRHRPDLIITDIRMPRLDGFKAVREICRETPLPVVFVTGYNEWFKAAEIERECVLVYLVKPVGETDLRLGVELVMQRFDQFRLLQQEERDVHSALLMRQSVEKAKGMLIRWKGMSDRQAFDQLRRRAADHRTSIADAAREILSDYET